MIKNIVMGFYSFIFICLFTAAEVFGQQSSRDIVTQIDRPARHRQLTYSPEEGSTVSVNPPAFIWVPVEPVTNNFIYLIQISRDKDFKKEVITRRGIDISTYALDQVLEPGEWYWRYGVEGGKGEWFWKYGMENKVNAYDTYPTLNPGNNLYSKARKFTILPQTRTFVYPGADYLLKTIPHSRPRLFILKDEIGSYRYRAQYGDLKQLTSKIRHTCDEHIGEALIAEVPATDSILKFLKTPTLDVGAKYQDETCHFSRFYMNMMEKFGALYLLTGEERYGEEAKRRILHFFSWDPLGPTSYYANNEAAMWMLYKGVCTYDWTYHLFSPEEKEKVEKTMRFRLNTLYDILRFNTVYHSNNFQSHPARMCSFLVEGALCFADKWPEAKNWLNYTMTVFWNLYPTWGKDDGGWHEGPGYYDLYGMVGLHSIVAIKKATGVDLTEKVFFQNTPYYFIYTNPPYAKMSPFGDLQHLAPSNTSPEFELQNRGEMLYDLSSLMNNPYARWYAEYNGTGVGKNILGVVLKNDRIQAKSPAELPQARYFPGVGLVSLHTNLGDSAKDIHFLFHSDPYGAISHSRPDQNAFTIEAFGEALAIASGYYPWWNSEHNKKWSYETRSANSITLDGGKGQAFQDANANGKITAFESNDLYDYTCGDATKAYKSSLNKYLRHVVHLKPGVFVLFDQVEAPKPVKFEWWLHALTFMNIDSPGKTILISRGNARLKVQFLQSGKMDFQQIKGFPDAPPEHGEPDHYHLIASPSGKSTKANFITLLVPFKKDQSPEVSVEKLTEEPGNISLLLNCNGKKFAVDLLPKVQVKQVQ